MKLRALSAACLFFGCAGAACAAGAEEQSAKPAEPPLPQLQTQPDQSFDELKQDLERAFRHFYVFAQHKDGITAAFYRKVEEFHAGDEGLSVTFKSAEVLEGRVTQADLEFAFRLDYDEIDEVLQDGACANPRSIDPNSGWRHSIEFAIPRRTNYVGFPNLESYHAACAALSNIASHYKQRKLADSVRFKEQAAQYRSLKQKPVMTEAQRRQVVQANALTQERNYPGAIQRYRQLLADDAVVYPAAYYNLALLSSELKLFGAAIRYMNRYLMLVPEAKDARVAQDKIYEWELKAPPKAN